MNVYCDSCLKLICIIDVWQWLWKRFYLNPHSSLWNFIIFFFLWPNDFILVFLSHIYMPKASSPLPSTDTKTHRLGNWTQEMSSGHQNDRTHVGYFQLLFQFLFLRISLNGLQGQLCIGKKPFYIIYFIFSQMCSQHSYWK